MVDRLEREIDLAARHVAVLRAVRRQEPIGIVALARQSGYPRHKIRYSLRALEERDLVEPTSEGAVTTDEATIYLETLDAALDALIEDIESLAIEPKDLPDDTPTP